MRALTCPSYGGPSVLQLRGDVPKPETSTSKPVLVKVSSCSLNAKDWRLMRGDPFLIRLFAGLRRPFADTHGVHGSDFHGTIAEIHGGADTLEGLGGHGADQGSGAPLRVGDLVMGSYDRGGALAEFIAVPAENVVRAPAGDVTPDEAACAGVAMMTAVDAFDFDPKGERTGRAEPLSKEAREAVAGKDVLITGTSGGVGIFSVQLAKALGAREVTAVCGSDASAATATRAGADVIVNYNECPVAEIESKFDFIIDAANFNTPMHAMQALLKPGGKYKFIGGNNFFGPMIKTRWLSTPERQMSMLASETTKVGLERLAGLLETAVIKPIIASKFTLDDGAEAMTVIDQGHPCGKVVVEVGSNDS